ncbi:MAG: alpha-amylase, partial [Proteobacteria bacterium]|nr:alpha-amylase [Pseudomonadota bacterium]
MKRRLKRFASRAALVLCLAAGAAMMGCVEADELPTEPNTPGIRLGTHVQDWRDEVIYQLIVDRFNNGDINNDFNVDTRSLSRYHGGD